MLKQIGGNNTDIVSARRDAYKGIVSTELAKYDANDDLAGAVSYLNIKMVDADADVELNNTYEEYKSRYRFEIIASAATAFETIGYAEALKIIEDGLSVLGNDSELLKEKSGYEG